MLSQDQRIGEREGVVWVLVGFLDRFHEILCKFQVFLRVSAGFMRFKKTSGGYREAF